MCLFKRLPEQIYCRGKKNQLSRDNKQVQGLGFRVQVQGSGFRVQIYYRRKKSHYQETINKEHEIKRPVLRLHQEHIRNTLGTHSNQETKNMKSRDLCGAYIRNTLGTHQEHIQINRPVRRLRRRQDHRARVPKQEKNEKKFRKVRGLQYDYHRKVKLLCGVLFHFSELVPQ